MNGTPQNSTDNNGGILEPFRRNKKRTVLLVALLPVMVMVWIPVIRGRSSSAPVPPPAGVAATDSAPSPTVLPPAPAGETVSLTVLDTEMLTTRIGAIRAPATFRWNLEPGSDPFVPAGSRRRAPIDAAEADDSLVHLVPSSILLGGGATQPVVVIEGRAYRTGDVVDGYEIISIEARRIVVQRGADTFAVSIPEPELRGNHE